MRQFAFVLAFASLVCSCNNSSDAKVSKEDTSSHETKISENERERQLVYELKKLGEIMNSGDKNKIAGIFPFPMSDTTFGILLSDTLQKEYAKNGNKITREMFLTHYKSFAETDDFKGFAEIFKALPLDSVTYTEPLLYELVKDKEPCVWYYEIIAYSDTVELQSGFHGFAKPNEADESYDVGCEYNSIWRFRFDGRKLRFIGHYAAG